MVRHATEPLSVPAGVPRKRIVPVRLDEEGVLQLEAAFLAGLREGDALGVPGPLPTCESCWTEPAVAIVLGPGDNVTFWGISCTCAGHQRTGERLVPLVAS
jgi:hypothetical protein